MRKTNDIKALLASGQYKAAEAAAIESVRANRLDAQAWVLLGEALLHRGYAGAAHRCFRRAWLLDPEAHWAEQVEGVLLSRYEGEERVDIEALLRVPNVSVSAVVIVKDEEATIDRCLASLRGAVDRILVFDNGSTDRTVEIAKRRRGVELRELPWRDSFGELRNDALSFVETDWVLWVDGDETLHEDDRTAVKEAAALYHSIAKPVVLNVWHLNSVEGHIRSDLSQGRLFRMGCGLKYFGRIHEQVGTVDGGIYDPCIHRRTIRIRFHHTGYEPDVVRSKDKIERNRSLLKRMVLEEPEDPGWWYFLSRETIAGGWLEEALDYLGAAERTASNQPRFGRLLEVLLMRLRVHKELGHVQALAETYDRILELEPNHPNVRMLWAERRMNEGRELLREAGRRLHEARQGFRTYRGEVSADPSIAGWRAELVGADLSLHGGLLAEAWRGYASVPSPGAYVEDRLRMMKEQQIRLAFRKMKPEGVTS